MFFFALNVKVETEFYDFGVMSFKVFELTRFEKGRKSQLYRHFQAVFKSKNLKVPITASQHLSYKLS